MMNYKTSLELTKKLVDVDPDLVTTRFRQKIKQVVFVSLTMAPQQTRFLDLVGHVFEYLRVWYLAANDIEKGLWCDSHLVWRVEKH